MEKEQRRKGAEGQFPFSPFPPFPLSPLLLCLWLWAGCAHISGRRAPDGTLTIKSTRFLWASEQVHFSLTDTNGLAVSLRAGKSAPDQQSLESIAAGVARGLKP